MCVFGSGEELAAPAGGVGVAVGISVLLVSVSDISDICRLAENGH